MLIKYFEKNLKNLNFLIAYSGGLDSTTLLYQFVQLRKLYNFSLRAVHINHGFNNESDNWQIHCHKQCIIWNVPFICEYLQIKKKNNLEAIARKNRYSIFLKHLKKNETLLTGHHIDDQCETFLLALKRGSGPLGLSSMSQKRDIGNKNKLIRPFLDISKNKIKKYAIKNKLSWIEDETNFDSYHDRNYLRNKIIPIFINRWPYFNKTVYRSAKLCQEQEKAIHELTKPILNKIILNDNSIIIEKLKKFHHSCRNILLRKWLIKITNIIPSKDFIERIWKEIVESRIDRSPQLKIKDYKIQRYRKKIYLIKNHSSLKNIKISWNKPWKKLILPQNIGYIQVNKKGLELRKPLLKEKVTIRFFFETKDKNLSTKKMKKIWHKFSIPPWERNKIPMIFYNEQLVCIIGIIITQKGICKKNLGWHILWKKN